MIDITITRVKSSPAERAAGHRVAWLVQNHTTTVCTRYTDKRAALSYVQRITPPGDIANVQFATVAS